MQKLVVWNSRETGYWCWQLYGEDNLVVLYGEGFSQESAAHEWGLRHCARFGFKFLDLSRGSVQELARQKQYNSKAGATLFGDHIGMSIRPTGYGTEFRVNYKGMRGTQGQESAGFADCSNEAIFMAIDMWRSRYAPHSRMMGDQGDERIHRDVSVRKG